MTILASGVGSERRTDVVLAAIGVALGLVAGLALGRDLRAGALVVAGCLLVALVLTRPAAIGVVACAATFATYRLGAGGSADISYSDVLLVLATAIALPSLAVGPWLRRLVPAFFGLAVYLVTLLPSVVTDDSSRGWFEWTHRVFLVGGALAVGAWLAKEGKVRLALRCVVAVAVLVSAAAVADSVASGFAPAFPLGMHKNFAGSMLKVALVLVAMAPRAVGLHRTARLMLLVMIGSGLLATQSRGAMIAAAAAILFVVAFSPRTQNRQARGVVVMLSIVLASFAYFSVRADFSQSEADFQNNSIGQRQQVEEQTRAIWKTSPVIGVGLKYFNSGEWGPLAQPANIVIDNELAESGLLGLAGFIILQAAAIRSGVRRRRREPFALVGAACVMAGVAHGMVDIYWTAGTVTLPFLVLGMALANQPTSPDSEQESMKPVPADQLARGGRRRLAR